MPKKQKTRQEPYPRDVVHKGDPVVVAHARVRRGESPAGPGFLGRPHHDRLLDLDPPVRGLDVHPRDQFPTNIRDIKVLVKECETAVEYLIAHRESP